MKHTNPQTKHYNHKFYTKSTNSTFFCIFWPLKHEPLCWKSPKFIHANQSMKQICKLTTPNSKFKNTKLRTTNSQMQCQEKKCNFRTSASKNGYPLGLSSSGHFLWLLVGRSFGLNLCSLSLRTPHPGYRTVRGFGGLRCHCGGGAGVWSGFTRMERRNERVRVWENGEFRERNGREKWDGRRGRLRF